MNNFWGDIFWAKIFLTPRQRVGGVDRGGRGDGGDGGGEVDQGEVSTIRLGMLESSGFRKYGTLLGKGSIEKKTFSFGHCPNYLNPTPP